MPDYDKIHDGPGPYQTPYRKLRDGMATEEVVDSLLRAIAKSIKYYEDTPISVLSQVAKHLNQLSALPLFINQLDWSSESNEIDRIIQQVPCSQKRGPELARRVCKRLLVDLSNNVYVMDLERALVTDYLNEMYRANFHDPVMKHIHATKEVDPIKVEVISNSSQLISGIRNLVDQILHTESVSSLRKPPRYKKPSHSNVTNVESIFEVDIENFGT